MTRIITDNSKVNETLIKQNEILEAKMIRLISENRELNEQLRLHSVSNSIATEYAEFCIMCDRSKLPLLCLEDYIKQYCV